jgi:hypothetical protein
MNVWICIALAEFLLLRGLATPDVVGSSDVRYPRHSSAVVADSCVNA